ncbi:acyltransferase domain-containing protein [Nocardia brasiliensis]|uniref:Acyltransferase domain-containing protein n=1 Tax=Nocardia brasiliensis TaxID=37326 RepID=A0A6G9XMI9_NOCBR|nr:acyltransferase domain-containing protein [Nocardia brasiliensis]QIS02137.1 acyltransferase domain-containing protein [Nocardia brasiliensis]
MGNPSLVMMFPGQGSQYPGMAAGLYRQEPTFTRAMDEVFTAFGTEGAALREDWLAETPTVPIDHVTRAQPLLFAVDYAMARMVRNWGFDPDVVIGHSIGELAAATFAEILSLPEATGVVLDRVRRIAAAPAGGMLAVAATVEEVEPYLSADVALAAINAPRQTILAGPDTALAAVSADLRAAGRTCRTVPSLSAFHSPMLQPAATGSLAYLATLTPRTPRVPVYSCYTTRPLDQATIADPAYWAHHPVATVRFWPTLDALVGAHERLVCVEAGPGQGLSTVARRHPTMRAGRGTVVSVSPARAGGAQWQAAAAAFAALTAACPPLP